MSLTVFVCALLTAWHGLATPVLNPSSLGSSKVLLPPKQDPFYRPPQNVSNYSPGDIIRSRITPSPLGSILPFTSENIHASYQLLYRTTDTVGRAAATVCTVIVPSNANYDKLLAYQLAYDSADGNCSPSYTLQEQSNQTSYDSLFIAAALNEGWVVVSTDYEGSLAAAFVAGIGSGQMLLDGVRATLRSTQTTGVRSRAKYALWGYSGGALASEWALELAPTYAPELKFVGAALGGLTPNATSVLESVNGGAGSGLAFNGVNGLMSAYHNLSAFVNHHLIPATAAEFRSVRTACGNSSAPNMAFKNVYDYFDQGADTLYHPVPQSILKYGTQMGFRHTPKPPVYAYKAIDDEVSVIQDTDALVSQYCSDGARIEYLRNTVGEHISEAITGSGGAFAFLQDRFTGKGVAKGCSTSNVTVSDLSLSTVLAFGEVISAALKVILMQSLGSG